MTELTCADVRDLAPAFVLGALERGEERTVTEHLRTCTDAHREVAELAEVTPYLDETIPLVEPPPSLRGRILAAAADDLAARRTPAPAADERAPTTGLGAAPTAQRDGRTDERARSTNARSRQADDGARPTDERVISLDAVRARRRDWRSWGLGLAAVLAIVALGAWNVATQQQLADARSYQQRLSAALTLAGQPGSQVADLTSANPAAGPGGIAVMPASGNGTLVVSGLAPTTGSQVYEAWAIAEGQPPTPVAGFVVGADGIGYLDRMPTATGQTVTVAITLEPAPNPSAPSSAPIATGVAAPPRAVG